MLFVEFGEFVEETVAETHQFFQSTRLSEGARAGVVFLVFRFMGQKNQSEVLLCLLLQYCQHKKNSTFLLLPLRTCVTSRKRRKSPPRVGPLTLLSLHPRIRSFI